eukprot:CAMPEP_0194310276 /NCGR_PEP_ID=MMETSP0171-20130528/7210_1 /TAXON_ID=218684 /ORGANISM="Corethron pennatum, Strain L29A3" /LENGTH=611 /DNA_ID=CAMNT_0039063817 /DNA_START=131 /DNA_END=1966 /DNA_ORIENTATION=+
MTPGQPLLPLRTRVLFLLVLLHSGHVYPDQATTCKVLPDGKEDCPSADEAYGSDRKITEGGFDIKDEDMEGEAIMNSNDLNDDYNPYLDLATDQLKALNEDETDEDDYDDDDDDYDDNRIDDTFDRKRYEIDSHGRCKDDNHDECGMYAESGLCATEPTLTHMKCPRSCLLCPDQHVPGKSQDENFWRRAALSEGLLPDFEDFPDDPKKAAEDCIDTDERCQSWANEGECENNPDYMLNNCKKACKTCAVPIPSAEMEQRSKKVYDVAVEFGAGYWLFVKGEAQTIEGQKKVGTEEIVRKTMTYMRDIVIPDRKFDNVRKDCINRHGLCAFWAVLGECENNPGYMTLQCAPSCETCHLIDIKTRCPIDPEAKPAFHPGEMDAMFQRIADGHFDQYSPHFELKPEKGEKDGLWIVTFDDFLTEEECDRLIALGHGQKYERSMDVGEVKFDGTFDTHLSTSRTSENAWCTGECEKNNVTLTVLKRIENVTTVPYANYESLQILKYDEGQFYRQHHDFIDHQSERQCGPRILTFFLYLSDVEEGGGTGFGPLKLTVQPKRGKALLWPSALDSNLKRSDMRTQHEALKVIKGTKFAANAWIHLYDYQEPNKIGCT